MQNLNTTRKSKIRTEVLKLDVHRGSRIYIRKIGRSYFEYLVLFDGEIYTAYVDIPPEKRKKKHTPEQLASAVSLIYAGAIATIDNLLNAKEQLEAEGELEQEAKDER